MYLVHLYKVNCGILQRSQLSLKGKFSSFYVLSCFNFSVTTGESLSFRTMQLIQDKRSQTLKKTINLFFLSPTGLPTDSAGILALPAGRSE